MFLELSHTLLKQKGRIGMLAPAGLYGDKGASHLRHLFLEKSDWEFLYGFDNKDGIFSGVHRDTKFSAIIVTKAGRTTAIKAAFLRRNTQDWESAQPSTIPYPVNQVTVLSPLHKAFWEMQRQRDLDLITKIYDNSVIVGDTSSGWNAQYAREFHMTDDSKLFPVRMKWEDKGYSPDAYGRWIDGEEEVAVPLYQGVMIGQFDISRVYQAAGVQGWWVEAAVCKESQIMPKFLMSAQIYKNSEKARHGLKLAFRDVSNPTNQRTMIATLLPDLPTGNVLGTLTFGRPVDQEQIDFLLLVTIFNSFTFDFCARIRMNGKHLNWFVVEELPLLPKDEKRAERTIALTAARLNHTALIFAPQWLELGSSAFRNECLQETNWYTLWASSPHERLRLRSVLDAIIAELYGLSFDDFSWILRNDTNDPKGFWRVDQHQPLELRQTTLALAAFRDLREKGLDSFCAVPDPEGLPGCGWQIPETLTFAVRDHGIIEFDASDGDRYTVRERLGPRFLPWQIEGTAEESWAECELHARNTLGESKFKRLMAQLNSETSETDEAEATAPIVSANGHAKLFATGHPNLFGEDTTTKMKRRKN